MKRIILAWFGLLYVTAFVAVVLAAAANGFVTVRPDARYGDLEGAWSNNYCYALSFTVPGSGTKVISEIGLYAYAESGKYRMALFTNDSENNVPEAMVSNSYTDEVTPNTSMGITYFSYGTKPQVTGGQKYWVAMMISGTVTISKFHTTGDVKYVAGTYPTFRSADEWHSANTAVERDISFYAVYEDEATTTTTIRKNRMSLLGVG